MDFMLKSGVVNQRVSFYTGITGMVAAGFGNCYHQRGENSSVLWTTPDIIEDANLPGNYLLLMDEDTTITSGRSTEGFFLVINHSALAQPVTLRGMIYAALPADIAAINGTAVLGAGNGGDLWRGP